MRCFVISPIGAPGSDVREHADDVFDFIIKPACERAGITPIRADHDTRPGVITEQMYDSILGDDLLIAVLSFHNPNVFYEIAIAEAAARPLILMIRDGDGIPFDIKDRRILTYDLRPRALNQKVHENALHGAIVEAVAASRLGRRAVPFRPSLQPLGAGARILERTNALDPAARVALTDGATDFLGFRGLAFFNIPWRDAFFDAVGRALERGVRPNVLLMDPKNPALEHHLRAFSSNYLKSIRSEIEDGIEVWTKHLRGKGEVRLQTRGFMQGLLQISDTAAIMTPYSLSMATADSPCLQLDSTQRMHKAEREEFDFVWKEFSRPAAAPSRGGRGSGSSKPRSGAGRKPSGRRKAGRGAASR